MIKLTKDERTAGEALLKILQAALAGDTPDANDDKQEKPAKAKASKGKAPAIDLEEYDDDGLRQIARNLLDADKIDATPQGIARRGRDKLLELFAGVRQSTLQKAIDGK